MLGLFALSIGASQGDTHDQSVGTCISGKPATNQGDSTFLHGTILSETGFLGSVENQPALAAGDDDRVGATAAGTPSAGAGVAALSWTGGLYPPMSAYVVDFTGNP